ncbi:hypothetical protein MKX03_023410 [Papaver bracteatum]|nr:hypothetical protein MKX03_023410 [Papaver bracteatum]
MAIEVAELLNVCWLDVNGKLNISKLNPGVKYEIIFVEAHVNLRLVHSGSQTQLRKEDLQQKPKSQWIELQVGLMIKKGKEIEFSLFECENQNWKRGLVIKGVIVRSKK